MKREKEFDALFARLVPVAGPADTMAGEIMRATARLVYRFYNDGDRAGLWYGKETCSPAARFLVEVLPEKSPAALLFESAFYPEEYEDTLEDLASYVLDYLKDHPEEEDRPGIDMYDYARPEDYDWDDEDGAEDLYF